MKPTKEGIAVLRRVIKRIEAEPKRLDMELWGIKMMEPGNAPPCGTVACIAGWTILGGMTSRQLKDMSQSRMNRKMENAAAKAHRIILGTRKGIEEGWHGGYEGPLSKLFYVTSWPEPFCRQYGSAVDAHDQNAIAKITIARIRHFIKTGE